MSIGSVGVSTGIFSRGFRQRGALSDKRIAIGTVFDDPAFILDFEMTPGDRLILAPEHELYSRFFGANMYTVVLVEQEELFDYLAPEPGAQDALAWRQSATLLTTDPATAAANTLGFRTLLRAFAEHGPTMSAEQVAFYRRCLLEVTTRPVIAAADHHYRGSHLRSAAELVRKVDHFLIEAGSRPVHTSELTAEFDVSKRTLNRAFEEVLGISPMQFSRRKRLGDVHNALLLATPGTTIEATAMKHGFLHAGRFAREYKLLFDELPSETLRRSASFRLQRA